MDNMTVVSLSSGILLFDLRSGERSNCRSSSSSGFMDPYQRCALLFAMYQTSLECSGDGIGMLDLGVESISFHPNQEADALIVLSFRSDFDEELRRRIAMSISKLFAAQDINSQNSPRASSVTKLRIEIKLYLDSLLLEKADKLSSFLLPNSIEADRNLCIYYEREDVAVENSNVDKSKEKIDSIPGASPTATLLHKNTGVPGSNNTPNRRGRFFRISASGSDTSGDSKFTTPVAPTKANWVNTIKSILGLRNRSGSADSSSKGGPNKESEFNVHKFSTHVHHFVFSPNESSHFDQEKWKIDNDKINPNIIVNDLVPASFSQQIIGNDRIYLEDEVTVSMLSNFGGCHYLWMYTRHRDDSGNVSMTSKKADLKSICASELVGNMNSIGQASRSLSPTIPTSDIFANMQICSDLVNCLRSNFG